jgi:hypothetical protein
MNLRFNAIPGLKKYLRADTDTASGSISKRKIGFGGKELVIGDDLKLLTSYIGSAKDKDSMFEFGDKLTQKNPVDSIVPVKPNKDENW